MAPAATSATDPVAADGPPTPAWSALDVHAFTLRETFPGSERSTTSDVRGISLWSQWSSTPWLRFGFSFAWGLRTNDPNEGQSSMVGVPLNRAGEPVRPRHMAFGVPVTLHYGPVALDVHPMYVKGPYHIVRSYAIVDYFKAARGARVADYMGEYYAVKWVPALALGGRVELWDRFLLGAWYRVTSVHTSKGSRRDFLEPEGLIGRIDGFGISLGYRVRPTSRFARGRAWSAMPLPLQLRLSALFERFPALVFDESEHQPSSRIALVEIRHQRRIDERLRIGLSVEVGKRWGDPNHRQPESSGTASFGIGVPATLALGRLELEFHPMLVRGPYSVVREADEIAPGHYHSRERYRDIFGGAIQLVARVRLWRGLTAGGVYRVTPMKGDMYSRRASGFGASIGILVGG